MTGTKMQPQSKQIHRMIRKKNRKINLLFCFKSLFQIAQCRNRSTFHHTHQILHTNTHLEELSYKLTHLSLMSTIIHELQSIKLFICLNFHEEKNSVIQYPVLSQVANHYCTCLLLSFSRFLGNSFSPNRGLS